MLGSLDHGAIRIELGSWTLSGLWKVFSPVNARVQQNLRVYF